MKIKNRKIVYLDNAATTMLCESAYDSMQQYLKCNYGNPSSIYDIGYKNRRIVEECRLKIANMIGAKAEEIIFTSCGSESDNLALKGVYFDKIFINRIRKKYNIIVSKVEHKAILKTCEYLSKLGVEIRYVNNDKNGLVDVNDLLKKIDNDTLLCSIMYVNNELGTIEPIKKISKICKKSKVLFHTDAVQAVGHLNIDVKKLGVDLLSASAHKFNGPKGIAFLYKKANVRIESLIHGGGQEMGLRAGTENVASIVGMTSALEYNIKNIETHTKYVLRLYNYLIEKLEVIKRTDKNFNYIYNTNISKSIYSHLNISFKNVYAENILNLLNLKNVCVSSGSACNSKENVISHVIKAIECPPEYANGSIRISLSYQNTIKEIDYFLKKLVETIKILNK